MKYKFSNPLEEMLFAQGVAMQIALAELIACNPLVRDRLQQIATEPPPDLMPADATPHTVALVQASLKGLAS